MHLSVHRCSFFFFFNDTATTEIYTLSLHDALPISPAPGRFDRDFAHARRADGAVRCDPRRRSCCVASRDRKSTRLNSSHGYISYAVFCLKKKKKNIKIKSKIYENLSRQRC